MPDTTHDASRAGVSLPDRDAEPSDGWLADAVRATTLAELSSVASAARRAGSLTARDQAWCRVLAAHLADVDAVAMREAVAQLGATVTGNGS